MSLQRWAPSSKSEGPKYRSLKWKRGILHSNGLASALICLETFKSGVMRMPGKGATYVVELSKRSWGSTITGGQSASRNL